ncbi:MAG: 4Fe-4S binding protein [Paracoccaceae bacterium]
MREAICVLFALLVLLAAPLRAEVFDRAAIEPFVVPPYSLGELVNDKGVYQLLNSGGAEAGFVFQTEPLAPLPGFSGAPINLLVILDAEAKFIDVRLLDHNEPIFVSGLGQAPFHKFVEQYRGHSISTPLVVGTPYGAADAGGALVYLDGVTKATASVRIAHESILAAALGVAREKMQGVNTGPPSYPDPEVTEALTWADLRDQGLVGRLTVSNAEVEALFKGTLWEGDDPLALDDPSGIYLDLYAIDLGPQSIANAVLAPDTLAELAAFRAVTPDAAPVLLLDAGRHGLVSDKFVRNTAPDRISAVQDGFPVALRDADLFITLNDDLPSELSDAAAIILRSDRRLGFDPSRPWTLTLQAPRAHGIFQPEIGTKDLSVELHTDGRFYKKDLAPRPVPPWVEALRGRSMDLAVLAVGLTALGIVMAFAMRQLAAHPRFGAIRLGVLAVMLGFVGWHGQGQLSIVTVLATLRTLWEGGNFAYLLYDPFSLMIWAVVIVSFVLWGRGFFCGWLCPFGALQEFADRLGRLLRLPKIEPSAKWDARLKSVKYLVLFGMIAAVFYNPASVDKVAEIEPFKTAITVYFLREWYYVAYAAFWLVLGMVTFKGFCRYVCPLGAVMAIGGLLRTRKWIDRRAECGSPCQLCKVKCKYGSIKQNGAIDYSECFQCLDCVTIHDDPAQCVPLILKARKAKQEIAA